MKNIRNCKLGNLMKVGLNPKLFPPERLFYWLIKPRNPVLASDNPLARMFIQGMLTAEPVDLICFGGSKPGSLRTVNKTLVLQAQSMTLRVYRLNVPYMPSAQGPENAVAKTANRGSASTLLRWFLSLFGTAVWQR